MADPSLSSGNIALAFNGKMCFHCGMQEALERAKKKAGGAVALSRLLAEAGHPVTSQAISQWRKVPSSRAIAVEAATGVSRSELRPDLWPPSEAAAAPNTGAAA